MEKQEIMLNNCGAVFGKYVCDCLAGKKWKIESYCNFKHNFDKEERWYIKLQNESGTAVVRLNVTYHLLTRNEWLSAFKFYNEDTKFECASDLEVAYLDAMVFVNKVAEVANECMNFIGNGKEYGTISL